MNGFTTNELADMHLMYGRANCNSMEARRLYEQAFPNRRLPNRRFFASIDRCLRETGKFGVETVNRGRPRTVLTPDMENEILYHVTQDPSTSTRRISAALNISQRLVWQVFHEELLHPYHLQRVQGLSLNNYQPRIAFCQWFTEKCNLNPNFINSVLFTDEAGFNRNGIVNFHNSHIWADQNPRGLFQNRHQQQFSVNVWAGIVGDELIGPHFLPGRLTGDLYVQFLQHELPLLLENVALATRQRMWFMHDGAPPHFSRVAKQFLSETYGNQWIGRGGPAEWPSRSSDLNPLDFYLWGNLKTLVYATPIDDVNELRQRIVNACNQIRNTPGVFERIWQSMRRRVEGCLQVRGGHFKHLL